MLFKFADKTYLEIPEKYLDLAQDKNPATRTYFWYVRNRPDETRKEAKCFNTLLSSIEEPPKTILELFGGIGMFACQIRTKWGKLPHTLLDYSETCTEHLETTFPDAKVYQVDSFELSSPFKADFIIADFNRFTFLQFIQNRKLRTRVEQLFTCNATHVEITDVSCSKLHLNKSSYAKRLGAKIETIEDYIQAVSDYIELFYGYKVKAWDKHHNASYLLFERIS